MNGSIEKNVIIENIRLSANPSSTQNTKLAKHLWKVIRLNRACLYKNTEYDKDLIIRHLNKKIDIVKNINDQVYGEKNLLYFSAFLDNGYIELLEICLKSIVKNTPSITFDLLIITDQEAKEKISLLPVMSSFRVDYMICSPAIDGQDASMRKLDVFDYEHINQYRKILFLDIDSLCVKDLNEIFNKEISSNILYVSYSEFTTKQTLLNVPFGIMYLSKKDAEFFYDNREEIMPFNAGQFFMINSLKMKAHFDNVRWLASAWPGIYFYEQSFMNYYFVFNGLVKLLSHDNTNKLISVVGVYWSGERKEFNFFDFFKRSHQPKVVSGKKRLVITRATDMDPPPPQSPEVSNDMKNFIEYKHHSEHSVVIHFASFGPGAAYKKKYMAEYVEKHNLPV